MNVESEIEQLCLNKLKKVHNATNFCDLLALAQLETSRKCGALLTNAIESKSEQLETLKKKKDPHGSMDVFLPYISSPSEQKERIHYRVCNHYESISDINCNHNLVVFDCKHHHHCLCDVSLITESGTYNAHKAVLSFYSEYFRAMFASNMLESNMRSIVLHDIDGCAFRRILDYIYYGKIHISGCDDALDLLQVSVYLQIRSMINCCCAFLKVNVTADSVCIISRIAREFALAHLLTSVHEFLIDHFKEMDSVNSNVVMLTADDMIECLRSDQLIGESNSATELAILRIVLRWQLSNQNTSKKKQHQIFSQVRFALIQAYDIMITCRQIIAEKRVSSEISYKNSYGPVFRYYLLRSLQYHQQIYRQPLLQRYSTNLRTSVYNLVSVDGVLASSPIKLSAGCKQITCPQHKKRPAIRDPFHSVIHFNGFLYVLGGTRKIEEGYR